MNKLFLIGNLTRDPQIRETKNGVSMCNISIAVQKDYSKGKERQADFFDITVWRMTADYCAKYLKKGDKIAVYASIGSRRVKKDNIEYTTVDITADSVEPLSYHSKDASEDNEDLPSGEPENGIDEAKLPF